MTIITLGDIATPLKSFGEHLDNVTKDFHDGLFNYWKERDFFHSAITTNLDNNGCICAAIPKFNFNFLSKNRFVFFGKDILSEIEFFTKLEEDEKQISLLKCYLRFSGELTFDSPDSPDVFDTDYDRNIESTVFGRVLSSAYDKKLISV